MTTGICPAEVIYCAAGQLPAPPCPCTLAQHAVPTLGQYGALALVLLVIGIGLAALWRHASLQDAHRKQHGPQPRYADATPAGTVREAVWLSPGKAERAGITPINHICPRHGWPCDSIAKRCGGCEEER